MKTFVFPKETAADDAITCEGVVLINERPELVNLELFKVSSS